MESDRVRPSQERSGEHGEHPSDLAAVVFCSVLQPSERPACATVLAAIRESLTGNRAAVARCVAELAARYGDDPEGAARRMRWCRATVDAVLFDAGPIDTELGRAAIDAPPLAGVA